MTIINQGDKPYVITLTQGESFKVYADNENEVLNITADYLESHKYTNSYYEHGTLEIMAECSDYKTVEALAKAYNLTCCGNNRIYIDVEEIKCLKN